MRRIGTSTNNVGRNSRRSRLPDNNPFLCDLVLLNGPNTNIVPRQGARVLLMENGHVLSACRFTKSMNQVQVECTILEAFGDKIPPRVDVDIVMSIHNKLVKPALAPGQEGINGIILHRLFKNKPVYVRPSQQLLSNSLQDDCIEEEYESPECSEQQLATGQASSASGKASSTSGQASSASGQASSASGQALLVASEQASSASGQALLVASGQASLSDQLEMDDEDLIQMIGDDDIPAKSATIHRSTIRKDVIELFSDENILGCFLDIAVIDARGEQEKGKGKGVLLDIFTEFWQDFFTALAVGSSEKTPFIRHDLQKPQWQSIARVLVYGYTMLNYFPLALSHLFIASCLFGEDSITSEFLIKSFREYIAVEDREVLDMCLGEEFDPNNDDVLEFLGTFKCFRVPTKDSIHTIINELAHQELIQKPRYVLNCWAPIVNTLRRDSKFQTLAELNELYESKRPTAKKIIKLFKAEPTNDAQRQSFDHTVIFREL